MQSNSVVTPEAYLMFSPISLVGNVETPTLLLTGDEDLRTPLSESEQFFQAPLPRRGEKVANVLAWFERYRDGGSRP